MSSQNTKHEMDMCNGPITSRMIVFAVPLILSSWLQLLFNAADIIVVGKYCGDNSMAAVGSNTALISLITNLFLGLSIGANVLVSRYYGARQQKQLSETIHTAIPVSFISGLFLIFVGIFGGRQMLVWMSTPANVIDLATRYLHIYFLGMPAMMLYNFGSAIMRSVGDTKRPLLFLFLAGILNVGLNLLFVIRFRMDVAGVAWATVISQCMSAALIVICLMREKGAIHLDLRQMRITWDKLGKMVRIGLPAGMQGCIFSLSNVVIQASVNSFGEVVMAGNTAAQNLEGFVYVAMNAFHQSTISFTSQNIGAGRMDRVKKILISGVICVTITGLVFGWGMYLTSGRLLTIYSNDTSVIAAGCVRTMIIGTTYFLCGVMDTLVGSIRGMGYSVMPTIVSLLGACVLRLIWLGTIFQMANYHKIETIYLSYPISWIITALAHLVCFLIVYRIQCRRIGNKEA